MNPVVAGALAGLIIGLPTFLISVGTLRQNRASQRATNALETRRVSRDEFETLKTELRAQLEDAKNARVAAEQRATAAEERAARAEERAHSAEQTAERLERRVAQLEDAMRAVPIEVPPVL